jgi:hypothetical protein
MYLGTEGMLSYMLGKIYAILLVPEAKHVTTGCMLANILDTAGIRGRAQPRGPHKCSTTRFTLKCRKLNMPVRVKTRKKYNNKKGTFERRAM